MRFRCPQCNAAYSRNNAELEEKKYVVQCTECNKKFRVAKPLSVDPLTPAPAKNEETAEIFKKQVPGWLEHEDASGKYPLKFGTNSIGRRSATGNIDVPVTTSDKAMGRNHCKLEVKLNANAGTVEFILCDAGSLNGTWISGKEKLRLNAEDQYVLGDNAKVEMGNTVVYLRKNADLLNAIALWHAQKTNTDPNKTIIVKIPRN